MKSKSKNSIIRITLISIMVGLWACQDSLEITPASEFTPENFLKTEDGMTALLYSSYESIQFNAGSGAQKIYIAEWPTDILWQTGGGQNRHATLYINFTWDSQHEWLENYWSQLYLAIRDANAFLDNVDNSTLNESEKMMMKAEARFIRATAYAFLYDWFGPTPLVTSSTIEELQPARATNAEMLQFIESELSAIAVDLPAERPVEEYGRATKGAALSILTKFLLNTEQWEKSAEVARQVMELGVYELYPDFKELFMVENEINNEFIFAHPALPLPGNGNVIPPSSFPPNYPTPGSHENYAAQVRLYDAFVLSFDENDRRKDLIITEYIDKDGNEIQLLGDDNARSFKYWPDPNANGRWTGNDVPEVRYADILLSRAEALNEISGPNQESITLINQVRARAGLDALSVSDFSSRESLRNHILKERGWEFYYEGKRRQDMIRHEVFISNAKERGENAQPYQILFPVPQSEIDANPNLVQNEGY